MVDTLHISNHKTPQCHVSYDQARVNEELPDENTMIAEQTFAWLSRYKVYMLYLNYTLKQESDMHIQTYLCTFWCCRTIFRLLKINIDLWYLFVKKAHSLIKDKYLENW